MNLRSIQLGFAEKAVCIFFSHGSNDSFLAKMAAFLAPKSCKSIRQVFSCLPWLYHQVNSSHESTESSLLQTTVCSGRPWLRFDLQNIFTATLTTFQDGTEVTLDLGNDGWGGSGCQRSFLVSLSKEDVENVPELPSKSDPKLGSVCNGHSTVRKTYLQGGFRLNFQHSISRLKFPPLNRNIAKRYRIPAAETS